jgi:CRISPR-associated protein Cmr6
LLLYRLFYMRGENKKEVLEKIAKTKTSSASQILLSRQEKHLRSLEKIGFAVCRWQQSTVTRLACGLGIPSFAENGVFMDRIHGLPYLPGTALKGVAQDQALTEMDVMMDADLRRKVRRTDAAFVSAFGSQSAEDGERLDGNWEARKGHVIFLDAFPLFPENGELLEVDIINPHYQEYYGSAGVTAPADYLKPNPTFFLTVGKNIPYSFAIAARDASFVITEDDGTKCPVKLPGDTLCKKVSHWLQEALMQLGIGGKTRVDYGYFGEPTRDRECGGEK